MPNTKKKSKTEKGKSGQLDHVEALLNSANFFVKYKKWYPKYMAWKEAQETTDEGPTPPGNPPPPPMP